ncbi:uncharacterized protein isoform X2 [Salmo salar]|uniref:Uncharacterized protein isoform X2 n=1 Tax=Salmo salar TaxID=8030 RepID=A0ABM3F4C7_SALSA|nr:uncharacterized protein LOC106609031 isoform X2 [Salmo salar]
MASSSVNDPSQGSSYREDISCSESNSESSATEEESDSDAAGPRQRHTSSTSAQCQQDQEEPCRYYNSGCCRDGKRCHYRHVCKYALRGNRRYGAKCLLKHPSSSSDRNGGGGRRDRRRSSSGGRGGGGRERKWSSGERGGGGRERRWSSSGGRGGGGRERRWSSSGGRGGGGRERRRSSSGGRGGGGRERRRSSSGGRGGGGRERRRSSSGGRGGDRARERSSSREAQRVFSGPYKWQLEDGHSWKDIANDHILEAQYSQPNNKGINIYNTPFGAVCIDFKAMRVRGKKNLRVRRLDGQQTDWIWFYSTSKGWTKYGEKDSKGNPGPIQSSEIEKKFQGNHNGSLTFNIGSDIFEIQFRQMRQVGGKRKRKVVRRPNYQPPQSGNLIGRVTSAFQRVKMSPVGQSESPEWQFGGKSGRWHTFKDSADIEHQYQQDFNGSMSYTVNGQAYKLDFSAMKQTNQSTRVMRNIRRVKRA